MLSAWVEVGVYRMKGSVSPAGNKQLAAEIQEATDDPRPSVPYNEL